MSRYFFITITLALFNACGSPDQNEQPLPEGRWSGYLIPMNHPEMQNPVNYQVSYPENNLQIELIGPGGQPIRLLNPRISSDTLCYSFREPEEQVILHCRLSAQQRGEAAFSGRCTDPSGKWAEFAMIPPDSL